MVQPLRNFLFRKVFVKVIPSRLFFIIVMERLNVALRLACHKSLFHGTQSTNGGPLPSHLFYAEDAFFFG